MKRRLKRVLCWAGVLLVAAVSIFIASPLPASLLCSQRFSSLRLYDRHGELLREQRSDAAERGVALPPGPIPTNVEQAFIAAEDHRFGKHPGVDPIAMIRTVVSSVRSRRLTGGASTITQQLARRLVPRSRTPWGKLNEALWSLRLTAHLSRETILRAYLDRVALGHSHVGVEAAARSYFERPAARLSLAQSALLAGITASPARFDPYHHPDAARARMLRVLQRMRAHGFITDDDLRAAAVAPWDLVPARSVFEAPHFTQWVSEQVPAEAAMVQTTLDLGLQRYVEQSIEAELAGLVERAVGQAAVLVVDNESGEILAYAGSASFFGAQGGQNDGVRAKRQPGSSLKPFVYGLALTQGLTPASLLSDIETHYATGSSDDYQPRNYDRRQRGPVRLRAALANSYNIPAVQLCERLGPARVLHLLRGAGYDSLQETPEHYGVALALGDGEVTLYEQARAYRGLARGGVLEPLTAIRRVSEPSGRAVAIDPERRPQRFLDAAAAQLLIEMLSDERARGPAFGLDNALRLPFPMAAKTGTSRAHVDNWAIGFTHERTVAVWVGNFDGAPMHGVSGITGAGPLLKRVMLRAMQGIAPQPLAGTPWFDHAEICALSGSRAGQFCPATLQESFLPGTAPAASCCMHRALPDGRRVVDLGTRYYAWARHEGVEAGPWMQSTPQARAGENQRMAEPAQLISPRDGDEFLLDPGLPHADQTIPIRALAPQGITQLTLRNDRGPAITLVSPFTARLPATVGTHRIELWVPGATLPQATATITVR